MTGKWTAIALGGLAAMALLTGAKADELEDRGQWIAPKNDLLKTKWLHSADGILIYGEVWLDCGVGAKGFATDCKVKASSNPALEGAALAVAPLYKVRDAKIPPGLLRVDMRFDEPPNWLKKPDFNELMAVYPNEAAKKGVSGSAVIKCIVQTNGLTRACVVVKDDNPRLGFGPAAVTLAKTFLFKPATRQGQPVEADVTVPVNFHTDAAVLASDGDSRIHKSTGVRVLTDTPWSSTPTVPEILNEIDKKVGDKFAEGKIVLQCDLNKRTGRLGGCTVANASPGMAQFAGVARALAPKFKANTEVLADVGDSVAINLAFAFPDMASPEWGKRYLAHPDWIQTFDAASKISTFPDAAVKAGLKTGTATVDCVVAANGALAHCETVRESTPNVGFGDTAIRIAETFATNPWNEDGLPVEGAHVRMPIQMDYTPAAKP